MILILLNYFGSYSQEIFPKNKIQPGSFALSIEAGAGGSYYSTKPNVPLHLETKVNKINEAFTFRLNWKTDHRLSVSVESGLLKFYSYTLNTSVSDGELKITGIPLLLEFAMPLTERILIRVGAGSYFQTSKLNYEGQVRSNSVSLGWVVGASYTLITYDKASLGSEIKWMDAAESEQAIVVLQLTYRQTFLRW